MPAVKPAPRKKQVAEVVEPTVDEMKAVLTAAIESNVILQERLSSVSAMFAKEDIGWAKINGYDDMGGLSLDELKDWSKQIREAIAGNPHIKRGARLRASYVWDGGIHYENLPTETRGRGFKADYKDNPYNQRYFFGNTAREERETALYSDSIVFYLGDDKTKHLEPIPLAEITGEHRNPNNSAEIWAYRREWTDYSTEPAKPMVRWYFTDIFKDKATDKIKAGTEQQTVDKTKTLFDGPVNTQIGWAYGIPDALSALVWARLYRDFLVNGKIMSDALATFAFKASVSSKAGASNAALQLASAQTPGSTAITGVANDLVPMSSAGKGYDFDSGRALIAVVATALEVSVIALTSDPGTAGSSYGSASTLDLPTRLAIKARRQWHIDFDTRVLRWMGAKEVEVSFDPMIDATDALRELQALVLKWSTGLYTAEAMKTEIEGHARDIPDGVLLPNNKDSWERSDIDPKDGPAGSTTTSSPGQGQNSAAGSGPAQNDMRTDTISSKEMLELAGRIGALIETIERDRGEREAA